MDDITSKNTSLSLKTLALPKGGGAIQGIGQSLASAGSTGIAEMSLPLPISAGRGYAPALALSYASTTGNGPFGIGWQLPIMMVRRATNKGTPQYDATDTFIGPNGELLVPERDSAGVLVPPKICNCYASTTLDKTYTVTRYFSRIEGAFNRLELWQDQGNSADPGFWLLHGADGQLHCLGKNTAARLADHEQYQHVAEWWLEESLSPTGQQIRYEYRVELSSDVDVSSPNAHAHSNACAGYLSKVYYGNKVAAESLAVWETSAPIKTEDWHFILVFDYGARGVDPAVIPIYSGVAPPPKRKDPFSRYEYGFESRMHLLCRQILMFHYFSELDIKEPVLVKRLLLEYDDNPFISHLVSAQILAYEIDGTKEALPPLDLRYTAFSPNWAAQQWQPFTEMSDLNAEERYQLVDLYGEGIPGVLSRTASSWRYRAPIRGVANADAISYDDWNLLPSIPAIQPEQMALIDMTGDGRLDWVIGQPGLAGYFAMSPDKNWSTFVPFAAWPSEFLHPKAQLADLVGAGLSDLAMIGPKSVRLYANRRSGFSAPFDVAQRAEVVLPIAGRDATELVAFSDMLGSGQQHLVSVRHDEVTCWPNLGRGRFGEPLRLSGLTLDPSTFNPEQVFLADLDGSGASDVIYAESDHLIVFLNRSGNDFSKPIALPLPDGVCYDHLCQLSCVDLNGLGVASLVLTTPHMSSRHWKYDLASNKPYLLDGSNNNMGADTKLYYRSSAQEWLDEKKQDTNAICHLPFPLQVLSKVLAFDEITGNYLTQHHCYRHGIYDGKEREFRGFGLVKTQNADINVLPAGKNDRYSAPTFTCTWFHTGCMEDLSPLPDLDGLTPFIRLGLPRFTEFITVTQLDTPLEEETVQANQYGLCRALKGNVRRQVVYGLDQSDSQGVPYVVTTYRYQVRLLQPTAGEAEAVVLPLLLESLTYEHERIPSDPVISQSVQLQFDAFGTAIHNIDIYYPRTPKQVNSPYPATLPDTAYGSSYDEQQNILRLHEKRLKVRHLTESHAWRLSLPDMQRQNILNYSASDMPSGGLSFEVLSQSSGLLSSERPRTFAEQSRVVYAPDYNPFIALVGYVEVAEFDTSCLTAYNDALDESAKTAKLLDAGYIQSDKILPTPPIINEPPVWVIRKEYITYLGSAKFYLPKTQQNTLLTGGVRIQYDAYCCGVVSTTDALENKVTAEYDYRFLQPWRLIDINKNTQEVKFDALGRVVASSFYGKENNISIGFDQVKNFSLPADVALAISHPTTPQVVASYSLLNSYSWMGKLPAAMLQPEEKNELVSLRFLTPEGFVRSEAYQWAKINSPIDAVRSSRLLSALKAIERVPIHGATFIADHYPKETTSQRIRIAVAFTDGFGRVLQTASKHEDGPSFVRLETGMLKTSDSPPIPEEAHTASRWVVSGRVEYDNKGQAVRAYPPFFVNDWRYIIDDSLRAISYADLHFYDPLGREVQVITAKGYVRKLSYFPWFTLSEDENDTLPISI